jgi:hypothetical protein
MNPKTAHRNRRKKLKRKKERAKKAAKVSKVTQNSINKLKRKHEQLLEKNRDHLKCLIDVGELAIAIKDLVEHGSYLSLIEANISNIDIRQIQFAVKYATYFDFKKYPILYYARKSHLKAISSKAEKAGLKTKPKISNFLLNNGINLEADADNKDERVDFLISLKDFLSKANTKSDDSKSKKADNPAEDNTDKEQTQPDNESSAQKITISCFKEKMGKWRLKLEKSKKNISAKNHEKIQSLIDELEFFLDDFGNSTNEKKGD